MQPSQAVKSNSGSRILFFPIFRRLRALSSSLTGSVACWRAGQAAALQTPAGPEYISVSFYLLLCCVRPGIHQCGAAGRQQQGTEI